MTPQPRPHSPDEPFLQAIREAPHDDTPRLQFADWLDEQGDPRGEFIRIQVELARMKDVNPRRPMLQERERQLWHAHGSQWEMPLQNLGARDIAWARGFPEGITVPGEFLPRFLRDADRVLQIPVTSLTIQNLHATPAAARRIPLRGLAQSPLLANLTSLTLSGNDLSDADLREVLRSPHLANLRALDLSANHLTDRGVRALARSPQLARLQCLDLGCNSINVSGRGIQALARTTHLKDLRELRLYMTGIGDEEVKALAASPALAHLNTLNLDSNTIGDDGARAIAQAASLGRVITLSLEGNEITDEGARAIASSRRLARLGAVALAGNDISPSVLSEITRGRSVPART